MRAEEEGGGTAFRRPGEPGSKGVDERAPEKVRGQRSKVTELRVHRVRVAQTMVTL